MKKNILLLVSLLFCTYSFAQELSKKTLATTDIKTLDMQTISSDELGNDGNPFIVSFWATWCKPCIKELNTIAEVYEDWQEETGVKLIAISIDDSRSMSKVKPFVNGNDWDFEVYLDPNSDFRRAMSVNMVPHTFLFNGNREMVDQHTSFSPGDEDELFEKVKLVKAGKSLKKEQ
ncbi:MAG: TlpA family protein disulfide reductase [Bacteroidia bacterium]|nr:TlpA family protein disulfide reductase [Bacteroidia bacterium]